MKKPFISKTYYFTSGCLPLLTWTSNFLNNRLAFGRMCARLQYDQEFQDKTIILFISTKKTKTGKKFSRICKSETIITEIMYCLGLVQPYFLSV